MIIEIPIHYEMTVKMPRAKTTREVLVNGTHLVDVPEDFDAALVAEIDADGWFAREDGSYPQHKVYSIDGEFWATTFLSDRGDDAETLVTVDVFKSLSEVGRNAAGMSVVGSVPSPHWESFPSEDAVMAKTIVSSKRDEACAAQDLIASRLRIVDGMVLRKASEPIYQIRWLTKSDELHVRQRFLDDVLREVGHVVTSDERFIWRLDQFDQMLDRMERFTRSVNRQDLVPATLHRPDLLSWDRWQRQLVRRFNRDIEHYAERHAFGQDTVEQFAAFAVLRDNGTLSHESTREEIAKTVSLVLALRERLDLSSGGSEALEGPFSEVVELNADMLESDREHAADLDALATAM